MSEGASDLYNDSYAHRIVASGYGNHVTGTVILEHERQRETTASGIPYKFWKGLVVDGKYRREEDRDCDTRAEL